MMARKVFQDFANVLVQRFIEVPSNRDLVNLTLFGGGILVMDVMHQKATCNRWPVSPLPYQEEARRWLESQLEKRKIPVEELAGATLIVEYDVALSRKGDSPHPIAEFHFTCTGTIVSPHRKYVASTEKVRTWGLLEI